MQATPRPFTSKQENVPFFALERCRSKAKPIVSGGVVFQNCFSPHQAPGWFFQQFFTDFDESFVTQTLFQWNPMSNLKEFELPKASKLSIVAVNVVIQVFYIVKQCFNNLNIFNMKTLQIYLKLNSKVFNVIKGYFIRLAIVFTFCDQIKSQYGILSIFSMVIIIIWLMLSVFT